MLFAVLYIDINTSRIPRRLAHVGIPGHDQWSGLRMGNAGSLNQIWQSNLTCSFNAKRTGHVAQVTQRSSLHNPSLYSYIVTGCRIALRPQIIVNLQNVTRLNHDQLRHQLRSNP